MAIKRTSPDIWQPALVDKIADLVGKEIITMWFDEEIELNQRYGRLTYDEEKVVETAIDRVISKIRLIMPDEVYDRIYNHACLDDYLHDLDLYIKDKQIKAFTSTVRYKPISSQLADVGMRVGDFV